MATVASDRLFGKSIKRREDPRFITGRGQYVDDLKLPGMTYAAFVRSPHAHAKIRKIDTVFRAPVLVDSQPVGRGVVTHVDEAEGTFEVDLTLANEAGETRVLGTALVALEPAR